MIHLTVSKFYEFLVIRSIYDNEKTPSLKKSVTVLICYEDEFFEHIPIHDSFKYLIKFDTTWHELGICMYET